MSEDIIEISFKTTPEPGIVFTGETYIPRRKYGRQRFATGGFAGSAGYVESYDLFFPSSELIEGNKYRFLIVTDSLSSSVHQYFLCVPFRNIAPEEDLRPTQLDSRDFDLLREAVLKGTQPPPFNHEGRSFKHDYNWLRMAKGDPVSGTEGLIERFLRTDDIGEFAREYIFPREEE